jgi:hypothetical protein
MISCEDTQPMLLPLPTVQLQPPARTIQFSRRPTQVLPPVGQRQLVRGQAPLRSDPVHAQRCESCKNARVLSMLTASIVIGWALGLLVGPI